MKEIKIASFDVGGHTKAINFIGNEKSQLKFADGFPADIPAVKTPHKIPAEQFMNELETRLKDAGLYPKDANLIAYGMPGPMEGKKVQKLINREICEPFEVNADAAINDAMAAAIGSKLAGVASDYNGAMVLLTLGTGVGFGSFHWDLNRKLVANNGEAHFSIRDHRPELTCNCGRIGCFESVTSERALKYFLLEEGVAKEQIKNDVGKKTRTLLANQKDKETYQKIVNALNTWQKYLAQGIANIFLLLDMRGEDANTPVFVMAGGLGNLIEEERLRELTLKELGENSLAGQNFVVRKEGKVGNRAGCVGAAALALANHLNKEVTEIEFIDKN